MQQAGGSAERGAAAMGAAAYLRKSGLAAEVLARIWDATMAAAPGTGVPETPFSAAQMAVALQLIAACQSGAAAPGLMPPQGAPPLQPPRMRSVSEDAAPPATPATHQQAPAQVPAPAIAPPPAAGSADALTKQLVDGLSGLTATAATAQRATPPTPAASAPPPPPPQSRGAPDAFADLAPLYSRKSASASVPPATSSSTSLQHSATHTSPTLVGHIDQPVQVRANTSGSFLSAEVLAAGEAEAAAVVAASSPTRRQSSETAEDDAFGLAALAQPLPPQPMPPQPPVPAASDAPLLDFGGDLSVLSLPKQVETAQQPVASSIVAASSPPAGQAHLATAHAVHTSEPLSALLRHGPMLPILATAPKSLAPPPTQKIVFAGDGSLFACPPGHGGGPASLGTVMRRWPSIDALAASARGMTQLGVGACSDDDDSAPSRVIAGSLGRAMAAVTAVCVDPIDHVLWTGHDDGVATAWKLGRGQGSGPEVQPAPAAQMRVHNTRVTALCVCRSDADAEAFLVTGSGSGTLRRWGIKHFLATFASSFSQLARPDASACVELQPSVHAEIRHAAAAGGDGDRSLAWFAGEFSVSCWDVSRIRLLVKLGASTGPSAELSTEATWHGDVGPSYDDGYHDGSIDGVGIGQAGGGGRSLAGALAQKLSRSKLGKYAARGARGAMSSAVSGFAAVARATGAGTEMAEAAEATHASLRAREMRRVASLCASSKAADVALEGSVWIVYEGASASLVANDGRIVLTTQGAGLSGASPTASGSFHCACLVPGAPDSPGSLWIGTSAGRVVVYDVRTGALLTTLVDAVGCGTVRSLSCGPGTVAALSSNGAVRVWSPRVVLDVHRTVRFQKSIISSPAVPYRTRHVCRMFCGTWNVNERKPSVDHIVAWLRGGYTPNSVIAGEEPYEIAAFGLQELEMSTSTVAAASLLESIGGVATAPADDSLRPLADAASGMRDALFPDVNSLGNVAQWWAGQLREGLRAYANPAPASEAPPGQSSSWTFNPAMSGGNGIGTTGYRLAACRALGPMALFVFVRGDIAKFVGEIETCAVPCGGPGGMMANKGGVACRFTIHRRSFVFVNSHLAAHQDKVSERNGHYERIAALMRFAGTPQVEPGQQIADVSAHDPHVSEAPALQNLGAGAVWFGDFNYRVDAEYGRARELAMEGSLEELWSAEQLAAEMAKGTAFRGFTEARVGFRPTFKFDSCTYKDKDKSKADDRDRSRSVSAPSPRWDLNDLPPWPDTAESNSKDPLVYDLSEKKRVPSWCDRVLFRGAVPEAPPAAHEMRPNVSDQGGTASSEWVVFDTDVAQNSQPSSTCRDSTLVPGAPTVEVYDGLMDVCQSDHKPVLCVLRYEIDRDTTLARLAAWHAAAQL